MFLVPTSNDADASARNGSGIILRRRMADVGMSQTDLALKIGKSQGWVSNYLFSDTQRTLRRMLIDSPDQLEHLSSVLEWSPETLLNEVGVKIPGLIVKSDAEIIRSSRTVPAFHLTVSGGKGGFVPSDAKIYIDEDWDGEFDAYILDTENMYRTTVIVRRQDSAQKGEMIVCETPEQGVFIAEIVAVREDSYFLKGDFEPFETDALTVRGVVVRKQEDRLAN